MDNVIRSAGADYISFICLKPREAFLYPEMAEAALVLRVARGAGGEVELCLPGVELRRKAVCPSQGVPLL